MQYSTIMRTKDSIGREMPKALAARVGEHRRARGRRPAAKAPDAAHDDWLQANAGARSQSDFWIQLLVVRNMGRPPL